MLQKWWFYKLVYLYNARLYNGQKEKKNRKPLLRLKYYLRGFKHFCNRRVACTYYGIFTNSFKFRNEWKHIRRCCRGHENCESSLFCKIEKIIEFLHFNKSNRFIITERNRLDFLAPNIRFVDVLQFWAVTIFDCVN